MSLLPRLARSYLLAHNHRQARRVDQEFQRRAGVETELHLRSDGDYEVEVLTPVADLDAELELRRVFIDCVRECHDDLGLGELHVLTEPERVIR